LNKNSISTDQDENNTSLLCKMTFQSGNLIALPVLHELSAKLRLDRWEQAGELLIFSIEISALNSIQYLFLETWNIFQEIGKLDDSALDLSSTDIWLVNMRKALSEIPDLSKENFSKNTDTIKKLLFDFNALIMSAAITNKIQCKLICSLRDGWVYFPLQAIKINTEIKQSYTTVTLSKTELLAGKTCITIDNFDGQRRFQNPISMTEVAPSLSFLGENVYLNTIAPYYSDWITGNPFHEGIKSSLENKKNFPRWLSSLYQGHLILKRFWPEAEESISLLVRDIVPIQSPLSDESLSSSSNTMIGSIMASLVEPELMAEMLVHEYSHNFLNILSRYDTLIKGKDIDCNYSPFRPDARPLIGLLHAMFSFVNVADYFHHLKQDDRYIYIYYDRYSGIVCNLLVCSHILSVNHHWTPVGLALIRALRKRTKELLLSPLWNLTEEIYQEKIQHFTTWCKRHDNINHDLEQNLIQKLLKKYINKKKIQETQRSQSKNSKNYFKDLNSRKISEFNFKKEKDKVLLQPFGRNLMLFRNLSLFPEGLFSLEMLHSKFGEQIISQFYVEQNKGQKNTPHKKVTLKNHLEKPYCREKNEKLYLGLEPIRNWPGVSDAVLIKSFLDRFYLNNNELFLFLNSKGTRVFLHQDTGNNLHFNIWGQKEFILFPPTTSKILYEGTDGYNKGFSPIDPFEFDAIRFPLFSLDQASKITLDPGDCLYIPSDWWHSVNYVEDTASVSVWDRSYYWILSSKMNSDCLI
jgi:HEXXH motif-containing protein